MIIDEASDYSEHVKGMFDKLFPTLSPIQLAHRAKARRRQYANLAGRPSHMAIGQSLDWMREPPVINWDRLGVQLMFARGVPGWQVETFH